jgi:predicted nucleotidyltransferase component of viral defense system
MGKIQIISKEQEIILDKVSQNDYLRSNFYFTGGTALSLVYLQHRESVDLDFFTEGQINQDLILEQVEHWSKEDGFIISERFNDPVYIFALTFPNNTSIKVDFARYPYKAIEKRDYYKGIPIDSLIDIATNKLLSVTQRIEAKDFVDLYFLLKKFTIWDLIQGVKIKFNVKIEPLLLGQDFLLAEDFDHLPKMIKPPTLEELKGFYRDQAKQLASKYVEP